MPKDKATCIWKLVQCQSLHLGFRWWYCRILSDYQARIKYDNILLAGDFNIDQLKTGSDSSNHLSDAKDVFNLINLVKKPTCFKSQAGTLIDLMLTNRPRSFLKSQNFEIGLSDCGNLLVFKSLFQKTSEKNHNL